MPVNRSALAGMAAGAVLTLGLGGAAVALGSGALADSTPSPSASSGSPGEPGQQSQPGQPGQGRHRDGMGPGLGRGPGGMGRMMGGALLHGEMVVQEGSGSGTRTVLVQQGSVTARTSSTVTVKSTDGFTVTWTVTSQTKGSPGDVAVGDQVHALGPATGKGTATAEVLHERGVRPDPAKRPTGT